MALRQVLRRGVVASSARQVVRGGGGHHGPPMPPFARNLAPSSMLNENHELVWNDGVAPETCIDFDAPHVSTAEALGHMLMGAGLFATIFGLVTLSDPESKRIAVCREETLPVTAYDPRTLFREGSPDKGEVASEADEEEEEEEE
ncbi:unnamed protein product [Choristocarpus tenellus]